MQWTGISANPLSETKQQSAKSNDQPNRKERQQQSPNPPSGITYPQCRRKSEAKIDLIIHFSVDKPN